MDSMRSLDTSLPRSSPRRRKRRQAQGQLLQAFKAAALSVTQLYKNATLNEDNARSVGYQDALDELLAFLDQENLGLGDGEGWRVRQWATKRLSSTTYGSEGEAESEEEKRTRSLSPVIRHEQSLEAPPRTEQASSEPPQAAPATSTSITRSIPPQTHSDVPAGPPEILQFRSPVALNIAHDVEMGNADRTSAPTLTSTQALRPECNSNPSKSYSNRHVKERALSVATGVLGHGAGAKRKQPYSDFFDISGLGGRDSHFGGGKKGRLG